MGKHKNNAENTLFVMELTGETTREKIDRLRSVILQSPEPEETAELLELFDGRINPENLDDVLDAMTLGALDLRHGVEILERQNNVLREEIQRLKRM